MRSANSGGCRFSDLQCHCQPRRRPGFHSGLRLQYRSRRPGADLGEWRRLDVNRAVLHRPGKFEPDPHRRTGRCLRCHCVQHLDQHSRCCPHRIAGRSSCRRRERQQYRNQRLRSYYRPGRHYIFSYGHSGRNCLRLRRDGHKCAFWAKARGTWRIALPTPFTADPTTSPSAGTSCTRWW